MLDQRFYNVLDLRAPKSKDIREWSPDPELIYTAALGTSYIVINLLKFLLGVSALLVRTKVDKILTEEIRKVTGEKKWVVYVLPDPVPNAYSFGVGKRIMITSTLRKMLSPRERIAVMLHEVYHSRSRQFLKELSMRSPFLYLVAYISLMIPTLPATMLVVFACSIAIRLLFTPISRRYELKADNYAARYGYGKELISALKKLSDWQSKRQKKCDDKICVAVERIDQILSTHPSLEKRVKKVLEEVARQKQLNKETIRKIVFKVLGKNVK